jgi:hypothetical protein
VFAVVPERPHFVMGGMQGADALLLGRVSTGDSPRPGPTIRSRTIPVREEVRGVTHFGQLVPGLISTPTEVPLVMDAPPERSPLVTTPKSVDVATGCPAARRQGRPPSGRHPAR